MTRAAAIACLCALLAACAGTTPKEVATVALPPAPPPGEPNGIAGMDTQALRVAFGEPAFVRKDGAIEMWRYDAASCKAFFFLYGTGGPVTVRHVETLPRGQEMAADEGCLQQLRIVHPAAAPAPAPPAS
jgi:hypothetical protein